MQVESGQAVSFECSEDIARRTESFLPVGWVWRTGVATVAAACEMAAQEGPENEQRTVKHKMPGERDCARLFWFPQDKEM